MKSLLVAVPLAWGPVHGSSRGFFPVVCKLPSVAQHLHWWGMSVLSVAVWRGLMTEAKES